jgi:hypothetical protein
MPGIGDLLGSVGIGGAKTASGGGGFMGTAILIIVCVCALAICGFGLYFFIVKKKNWNIKVEFKIPRNIRKIRQKDGVVRVMGTLNKEWGKGFYNPKNGVVLIKRKGKKASPMKPFDIKTYLSSGNILTVMQVGIEDYRPILDESYIQVIDEKTGEENALVRAKIDTSEGKSWRNSYERERKNTYAITNWLKEHGTMLSVGLILLMNFIGFAILWKQVKG